MNQLYGLCKSNNTVLFPQELEHVHTTPKDDTSLLTEEHFSLSPH